MASVLLIEDDKAIASAYLIGLQEAGFEVEHVLDGESAVDMISFERQPDVILLDLLLPGKSGFVIMNILKKTTHWKDVPVIIISNFDDKDKIEKGKELGAVDYFVKSDTSMEDLVKSINACLK